MLLLKIIGIMLFLLLLYLLMEKINKFTLKKYSYEFFSKDLLGVYIVIYAGLFFGYKWYLNSLVNNTDILNGIILMSIASLIFLTILIKNIKSTTFYFGLLFTIIQAILFIPFVISGFIVILMLFAYFSQTKPVYNIN